MVVAGLLFLAFAWLAVGQAAANRNGAQTAADAAALAAAQDTRDQLADAWVENVRDPAVWQRIFEGDAEGIVDSCWRASELAAQNDAAVDGCHADGLLGYTVTVETNKTVGDSIVPGTESMKSTESASAVIEALCTFEPPVEGGGTEPPAEGGETEPPAEGAEDDELPQLTCEGGGTWTPDPEDPTGLPEPQDLFDVHLAD
ncbi:pilus assembly protein TadG-related protein [Streptomyces sp. NPDC017936]|uniref:pilus assembly protein TadG-related protein n=1 Tax=Streptomyces sp. NPDC017936 TaxID=3365016 RepID=UPI0037B11429